MSSYLDSIERADHVRWFRRFALPAGSVAVLIGEELGFEPPDKPPPDSGAADFLLLFEPKAEVCSALAVDPALSEHAGVQDEAGKTFVLGVEALDEGLFNSVVAGVASRKALDLGFDVAHAACVVLDGVGVLILGSHGQGKTTLLDVLRGLFGDSDLRVVDDDWVLYPADGRGIRASPLAAAALGPDAATGQAPAVPIGAIVVLEPRSAIALRPVPARQVAEELVRGSYHMPNADLPEAQRTARLERCLGDTPCWQADFWNLDPAEVEAGFRRLVREVKAPS